MSEKYCIKQLANRKWELSVWRQSGFWNKWVVDGCFETEQQAGSRMRELVATVEWKPRQAKFYDENGQEEGICCW